MRGRTAVAFLLMALGFTAISVDAGTKTDPSEILERARSLTASHRPSDALALLEPLCGGNLDEPVMWEINAEAARAAFHCGRYTRAYELLEPVVRARPQIVETALYFEATSYVLGNHAQAFSLFEAIVSSGAEDLYLAVTLPGERAFLKEQEVRRILSENARPLIIRPEQGTVQALRLGASRAEVAAALGLEETPDESTLTARTGPLLTWILSFGSSGELRDIALNARHLDRYTPFRLDLSDDLTWDSAPGRFIENLGTPSSSAYPDERSLLLTWRYPGTVFELLFSRPAGDLDRSARLELIRLRLPQTAPPVPDSG